MTSVQPAKKIDREKNKKESTTKHSAILELLDKNGDGLLDEEEQPWKIKPKGCCAWAKVLVSFSWLRKFLKSPVVGTSADHLYVIPGPAMNEIEKEHNEMMKVTVDDVIQWLGEITKKNEDESYYFSKDFKIETVVDVFKNEGICGMALPSVNEKFLREKCKLKWGDAYLLMKEIKLRKGHVIHWLESKAV